MENLKNKSDPEIAGLAVRTNSKDVLVIGLDSLFSSNAVYDYRDIISSLVLYYDAAKRLNLNPDQFFLEYAKMNYASKEHISKFVERSPELKTIEIGGYKVAEYPEFQYVFEFNTLS